MIIQPINTATTAKGTPALAHAFVRVSACAAGCSASGMAMIKRVAGAYRSFGKQPTRLMRSLGIAGFMAFAGNGVNNGSYRYDSGGSA